jgi:hypothetical protein
MTVLVIQPQFDGGGEFFEREANDALETLQD